MESELKAETAEFERFAGRLKEIGTNTRPMWPMSRAWRLKCVRWGRRRRSGPSGVTTWRSAFPQRSRRSGASSNWRREADEQIAALKAGREADAAQAELERKLDALQAEQAELTRGQEEIIQRREALKEQAAGLQMRIFTLEKGQRGARPERRAAGTIQTSVPPCRVHGRRK